MGAHKRGSWGWLGVGREGVGGKGMGSELASLHMKGAHERWGSLSRVIQMSIHQKLMAIQKSQVFTKTLHECLHQLYF